MIDPQVQIKVLDIVQKMVIPPSPSYSMEQAKEYAEQISAAYKLIADAIKEKMLPANQFSGY